MMDRILAAWCRKMHDGAMWPINGHYICPECLRVYRVEWEEPAASATPTHAAVRSASASMDACA